MRNLLASTSLAVLVMAGPNLAHAAGIKVEIARTAYGIPHVLARDYASLGYGEAYAYLQDNLCLIADKVVTVNGDRSKYFGADETTTVAFTPVKNFEADLFFKANLDIVALRKAFARVSPDYRNLVRGYVAGYNRYLRDHPAASRPEGCREDWIRPINLDDMLRLNEERMIQASGAAWLKQAVAAAPPAGPAPRLATWPRSDCHWNLRPSDWARTAGPLEAR